MQGAGSIYFATLQGYVINETNLYIMQNSDESNETTNIFSNFNDVLRWLWNSVYMYMYIHVNRFCRYSVVAIPSNAQTDRPFQFNNSNC